MRKKRSTNVLAVQLFRALAERLNPRLAWAREAKKLRVRGAALARLRAFRGIMAADFQFDREEANLR